MKVRSMSALPVSAPHSLTRASRDLSPRRGEERWRAPPLLVVIFKATGVGPACRPDELTFSNCLDGAVRLLASPELIRFAPS